MWEIIFGCNCVLIALFLRACDASYYTDIVATTTVDKYQAVRQKTHDLHISNWSLNSVFTQMHLNERIIYLGSKICLFEWLNTECTMHSKWQKTN